MVKELLVSCIMPTANRQKYIPYALNHFLKQDYANVELVIIDDGETSILPLLPDDSRINYFYTKPLGSIGMKRNYACEKAKGEIIAHWDDDEWYATDWISKQVHHLLTSGADICGIEFVHYFSPVTDTFLIGSALNRNNPSKGRQWLNGPTIAYWKSFWKDHPFQDIHKGEDDEFVNQPAAKTFAHDYIDGFVKILHPENTTIKYFEDPKHKTLKK
ncbi:glycosyltransferase family 2 protein [Pedobacter sp. AW31-3R]|uniref:glycosyltransferase family 2 protein n=1 Tax=Pedobacter sp. AW31-3R TaxID=3445781 RepID=UPI003F9F77C7